MVRITMEDGGIIDIELNEEAAPITLDVPARAAGAVAQRAATLNHEILDDAVEG